MQLLYRFLHFLVTLIFSLLISFRYYFKLTRRKIRGVFYTTSECDIKNGVATLRSLPRHLAFIVMEKDVDLCILARLVVWSITVGISYISIQTSEGKERIAVRDNGLYINWSVTVAYIVFNYSTQLFLRMWLVETAVKLVYVMEYLYGNKQTMLQAKWNETGVCFNPLATTILWFDSWHSLCAHTAASLCTLIPTIQPTWFVIQVGRKG